MNKFKVIIILILFIVLGSSFIVQLQNIFIVPLNFPNPVYDFKKNPVTPAGFALGRHLFYDPILSKDSSIACDNCHQPFAAYANIEHLVSHGMNNCLGTRNAPPLINLAWQKSFMLDGGVNHLDKAPLRALLDTCEMFSNLDTIVSRLKKDKQYPKMFAEAFGSDKINTQKIMKALSQFMVMLISANSKYDKVKRKESNIAFTEMENEGYLIFQKNCESCHKEPLFSDYSYRNNGLDSIPKDLGRNRITGKPEDIGLFKVPTLRNIALTYPYMHDGRYPMLYHALAHYTKNIKKSPTLDSRFENNGRLGFSFTNDDLMKLVIFLKTLTDTSFLRDKRFAKPKNIYYKNQIYF